MTLFLPCHLIPKINLVSLHHLNENVLVEWENEKAPTCQRWLNAFDGFICDGVSIPNKGNVKVYFLPDDLLVWGLIINDNW